MSLWHKAVVLFKSLSGNALGFLLFLSLASCGNFNFPPWNAKPNIVLIVIDTLRADHVGCYGYSRPTTPELDRLAAQGVIFDNVHALSSWTVPSMSTMMTSVNPFNHGVTSGILGFEGVVEQSILPDGFVTLAEKLQKGGYRTFGISSNVHVSKETGFDQGFDEFQMLNFVNAEEVERTFLKWMSNITDASKKGRYFLYLHFIDPHHEYIPHEPYIEQFHPNYKNEIGDLANTPLLTLWLFQSYFKSPDDPHTVMARDLYDSEIRNVDDVVERIIKKLPRRDNTFIMVTSDHGEEFMEHGNMIHGIDLNEETLRVPLVMRFPKNKYAGLRLSSWVNLLDIAPTCVNMARLLPIEGAEGQSVLPLIAKIYKGRYRAVSLPLEVTRIAHSKYYGIIHGRYKLIVPLDGKAGTQLYDLEKDPQEKLNLFSKNPEIVHSLQKLMETKCRVSPRYPVKMYKASKTGAELEQLKNLGYLH